MIHGSISYLLLMVIIVYLCEAIQGDWRDELKDRYLERSEEIIENTMNKFKPVTKIQEDEASFKKCKIDHTEHLNSLGGTAHKAIMNCVAYTRHQNVTESCLEVVERKTNETINVESSRGQTCIRIIISPFICSLFRC